MAQLTVAGLVTTANIPLLVSSSLPRVRGMKLVRSAPVILWTPTDSPLSEATTTLPHMVTVTVSGTRSGLRISVPPASPGSVLPPDRLPSNISPQIPPISSTCS